jgi:asparagine synthase (glutamine-hydrolysing)
MCGLAGCFGIKDEKTINRMLDTLRHRGPDDQGIIAQENMVIGHRRLSIVDVDGGHQPILTDNGRKGIICNGEIYNFRNLRNKLELDYLFTTQSDTEVILHLYQKKGPECVKDLDGMFAFALFDGQNYMLARDPIGIKPLYYGYHKGNLYFSSELGAMSIANVDDVHEFPPAHYYTPDQGFVKYYDVPPIQDYILTNLNEVQALIQNTLIRSVKKRLLADNKYQ